MNIYLIGMPLYEKPGSSGQWTRTCSEKVLTAVLRYQQWPV